MTRKPLLYVLGSISFVIVASVRGVFLLPKTGDPQNVFRAIEQSVPKPSVLGLTSQNVAVFCINLDRDQSRYQAIAPLLNQLKFGYQRVSAVYGKALPSSFIKEFVDAKTYKLFFNGAVPGLGEVGCFLSHVKVWKQFLDSSAEFALILEDDARFDPAILTDVVEKLVACAHSWDICSLFSPLNEHTTSSILSLSGAYRLVRTFHETSHTLGIMLNRKAAQALLSKAHRYTLPVDHYIQRTWEFNPKLQFAVVTPSPLIDDGADSTITQAGRRVRAPMNRIQRSIQRLWSQMCHAKSYCAYYLYNMYLKYTRAYA